jgi:acyl-CoA thioesterase FadM
MAIQPQNPKTYRENLLMPFRYADSAGIMFFGNAFLLAHDVYERFVVSLGFDWDDWFNSSEAVAPIRFAECDFRKPLLPGQTYQASLEVLKLSDSSATVQICFQDGEHLCAAVKLVIAFANPKTRTKIGMPPKIREALSEFLNRLGGDSAPRQGAGSIL